MSLTDLNKGKILNKWGFQTNSAGTIKLRLNVVIQGEDTVLAPRFERLVKIITLTRAKQYRVKDNAKHEHVDHVADAAATMSAVMRARQHLNKIKQQKKMQ
jgi:hypothetical protein